MPHIKLLIGELARPLVIAMLFAVLAAGCRVRGWRRLAMSLVVVAVTITYLGAIEPFSNALLAPLEGKYPPLSNDQRLSEVRLVVVLGSGYSPRDHIPVTAALDGDGMVRIVEGVRLMRRMTDARLVVSGGAPPGAAPPAYGYAQLARDLGVPNASLVISSSALDTAAEAHALAALLGQSPFILVTSAYHMPRAMRLMSRAGAHPIPAPTGQLVGRDAFRWVSLLPASAGLRGTELALHEYLGLAAIALHLD